MRAAVLAFCLSGFLAGCEVHGGEAPAEIEQVGPRTNESGRPILAAAGVDVVPVIRSSDALWSGEPLMDSSDGRYPITRRKVIFPNGTIVVDRAEYGDISLVRVSTGFGERCGDPKPLPDALSAVIVLLSLPQLPPADLARLQSAWQSKGDWAETTLGDRALVRAIGGCVRTLVIAPHQPT